MAYDLDLTDRLREALVDHPKVEEKKMFSGVTFMVDGKMCICVSHDNLLCRFDPALSEEISEKEHVRPMMSGTRSMKGYAYVEPDGFRTKKQFDYWVKLCLDYNPQAKASKKPKKK